jgi:hypothetical protein
LSPGRSSSSPVTYEQRVWPSRTQPARGSRRAALSKNERAALPRQAIRRADAVPLAESVIDNALGSSRSESSSVAWKRHGYRTPASVGYRRERGLSTRWPGRCPERVTS